jgi:hypothetical protein
MSKIEEVEYISYVIYQHIEGQSNTVLDSKLRQKNLKVGLREEISANCILNPYENYVSLVTIVL